MQDWNVEKQTVGADVGTVAIVSSVSSSLDGWEMVSANESKLS